ncbi:MAG TPA: DNA-deoxyinosine glycosylase [Casimicrobiaceae bacterium]|jgi:hypoxanthine-DNA glycosylase
MSTADRIPARAVAQREPPTRRRGLPPIVAPDARVLILGSFPSEASLAARQYYAHPRNHFWPVLAALLNEPLVEMSYSARTATVRAHGIAIWDTIVACERKGSLDTAIRNAERGAIARIRHVARDLEAVCFNGGTAARAEPLWRAAGLSTLVLPSTSPAYTLSLAKKIEAWRVLMAFL